MTDSSHCVFRGPQTSWRWGRSPSWWHSRVAPPPPEHHYQVPPASGHWDDSSAPRCPNSVKRRRRQQTSHSRSASSSFQFLLCPRSSPRKHARRRDHMTSVRKRHWLNSDQEGGGSEECVFSCKYSAAVFTETPRLKVLFLLDSAFFNVSTTWREGLTKQSDKQLHSRLTAGEVTKQTTSHSSNTIFID